MVYDGARWVADQSLRFTRFGEFWNDIHQSSQQAFRDLDRESRAVALE